MQSRHATDAFAPSPLLPRLVPLGRARVLVAPAFLVATLGATGALAQGAAPALGRKVVVMESGSRMEATRAWIDGDSCHVELAGGALVVLPASSVRRISSSAADLPTGGSPRVAAAASAGSDSSRVAASTTASTGERAGAVERTSSGVVTEIGGVAASRTSRSPSSSQAAALSPFANMPKGAAGMSRFLTRVGPRGARGNGIDRPRS